jgi:hypothetical protein
VADVCVNVGVLVTDVATDADGRAGGVYGTDGVGSIELLTTTPGREVPIDAATIQHPVAKDGAVHGVLEFTADAAVRDRGAGSPASRDGPPLPCTDATEANVIAGIRPPSHAYDEQAYRPRAPRRLSLAKWLGSGR